MTNSFTVRLPRPHEAQRTILQHPARYKVVACGRRFGKSTLARELLVVNALSGRRWWWVAPTYKAAEDHWRSIKRTLRNFPGINVQESLKEIRTPGGGYIGIRSTHNYEDLRGPGLHGVVMDEAAYIQRDAWIEVIQPMLLDAGDIAQALFLSTPNGRNWFWDLYRYAETASPIWAAFSFPTQANPRVSEQALAEIRSRTPDRVWREEYMAEFIEDESSVFRGVRDAAGVEVGERPEPGGHYVMGVDWGQSVDYTALVIMEVPRRRVVAIDRFNQVGWGLQYGRIKALYDTWKPQVIQAELNSMGGPNIEALQNMGLPVVAFNTNAQTKRPLIEQLALAIETNHISLLNDETLLNELLGYEVTRGSSGIPKYSAPAGFHDDLVIALALAYDAMSGKRMVQFTEAPELISQWRG